MTATAPDVHRIGDPEQRLAGLAAELRRQLDTKRDLMADTRRVSLSKPLVASAATPPDLDLLVDLPDGPEAFSVTRHAHQQIAGHLDIPWKFYERLLAGVTPNGDSRRKKRDPQTDLLAHLTNGLLARVPTTRMIRTMDGQARAFLSDRYRPRDNWELLNDAVLPVLADFPGRVEVKRCDLTETHLYVKVFLPDLVKSVTPKVGDVIRGGLLIKNSEVGASQLLVAPYTDVLRCTNGMVHTTFGQGHRHVGGRITGDSGEEAWEFFSDETLRLDDAAFFAKVRDTVAGCLNETVFDAIVKDMRDLASIEIPDAPKAVEVIAERVDLTDRETGSMLDALIDEGDRTAWGLVNALTRTARDLDDADRQTDLETAAGVLVSDSSWATPLAA